MDVGEVSFLVELILAGADVWMTNGDGQDGIGGASHGGGLRAYPGSGTAPGAGPGGGHGLEKENVVEKMLMSGAGQGSAVLGGRGGGNALGEGGSDLVEVDGEWRSVGRGDGETAFNGVAWVREAREEYRWSWPEDVG